MSFTKKHMTADYERLYIHASLLELYLYDTQSGRKPDAEASDGKGENRVRVQLYRATGAAGGYVIISGCVPNIWTLEEANRIYSDNHSEHTLSIRVCLERVTAARNRLSA